MGGFSLTRRRLVLPPTPRGLIIGALLLLALALRVGEVERVAYRPVNDAGPYLKLASEIANSGDYSSSHAPGVGAGGTRGPSAYFPPGFPYFLAAVDLLDGHSAPRGAVVQPARISQAVLGTITVALVGLLALEAFGSEAVALIALALAAIYPVLIELSGILVPENLMTPLILAAAWAVLRARRSPRPYPWITLAGLLTGLATLTHANSIVILLPLGFAVWGERPDSVGGAAISLGRGLLAPALLVLTTLLTLTPWLVRNEVELHRFVFVTDETGITLVGTYNPASAANQQVPYKWRLFYGIPGQRRLIRQTRHLTEPALGSRLESQALHYIDAHPTAPLAVIYHNSRRLLELEGSFAWRASAKAMGLPEQTARIGVISFWVLGVLAALGLLTRAARAGPKWLWAMALLLWLSVAAINVETPRFREPVDPFLILLAACAVAGGVAATARRLVGAPVRRQGGTPVPSRPTQLVEVIERLA
jgi:hypothetical protein